MSDLEYHLAITTITKDVKHDSKEDTRTSKYTWNDYVFETSSCSIALKAAYFTLFDPPHPPLSKYTFTFRYIGLLYLF